MKTSLHPGQAVQLEMAGVPCEIRERLGTSIQAEVYRASFNGRDCILKWYFPHAELEERRTGIERLLKKGAPSDNFHWPCDIASSTGTPGFGYVTPMREARFRSFGEVLSRRAEPSFRPLTTAALGLAEAFFRLHMEGLAYSHLSLGHLFLDPLTGEVLLCENDEVTAADEEYKGGLGHPRFLAPELITGRAGPGTATDLHALAVLLFHLLFLHHPLEGKLETECDCLDLAAMRRMYGETPIFIFDPKNLANRPVGGLQDNALIYWNFYPGYVRDTFQRAFTNGLHDPAARVTENEWRAIFARMRDQIFYCDLCGAESFLPDQGNSPGLLPRQECWACGQTLPQPLRLRLAQHAVALNQDTVLYAHHLDAQRRNDFSQIMAEMTPHPTRAEVWGLKNISAMMWSSHAPSGTVMAVPSGRSVSLVPGLRIRFGNVEGTVM
jgi:hypothetical protein